MLNLNNLYSQPQRLNQGCHFKKFLNKITSSLPLYLSDGGRNFPGYILKKVNFYSPAMTNIYTPSTAMTVTTTTATIEQPQEDSVSLTGANANGIKLFSLSFSNKLEC